PLAAPVADKEASRGRGRKQERRGVCHQPFTFPAHAGEAGLPRNGRPRGRPPVPQRWPPTEKGNAFWLHPRCTPRRTRARPLPARRLQPSRYSSRISTTQEPAMQRRCTRCERPFAASDLARDVSKGMEAVLFHYYACPACGQYDIFVDINPL